MSPTKIAALLALGVSAPVLAAEGRLPAGVVPVAYDIEVVPDAKAARFTGRETVTIDVIAPTRTIVLNAVDLVIGGAMLDGKPLAVATDAKAQTLTLTAPATVGSGRHSLAITWAGTIATSAAGLFSIDYTNADGSSSRMLATQFEAPDARRFAPMWDEPAFKATFRLATVVPDGQQAYSNMPVTDTTERADGSRLVRFGTTPVMSSYLLFVGIGNLERKAIRVGQTEIGVVTRRGVVGQGDYALASAKRLLGYYNEYFAQPYPLPKLDMLAGPGSSQFFGAMENWGAIFYFERELLFDPVRATESGRQRIHVVAAHEMAHQWFGDLVTMRWWDDLWLNEGFASWMEAKAGADLNPDWHVREAAIIDDRERAMGLDSTAATHAVIRPIRTVSETSDAFDAITYQKGQAVIGMLEATLGADAFRQSIRSYMAKYRYGNTVTDQLWAELAAASGQPVASIAHDFTLQGGVPLVTLTSATCRGGVTTAMLSQRRFGVDAASKAPRRWQVPIVVGVAGGAETRAIVAGATPTPVTLDGCGPVVLNVGKGSYTRVSYDAASHAALVEAWSRLSLADRLGTLADDFALARSGDQDLARWTAALGKVGAAADPLEWSAVAGEMATLDGYYSTTPLKTPLRARTIALLSPVLARIGRTATAGEPVPVTNLRETLIGVLGVSGDGATVALARDLMRAPAVIPPAIRQPILATYAANATAQEWERLRALTIAERNPPEKTRLVALLGAADDDAVAARAFALLEGDSITAPQKGGLLAALGASHPDAAFDWAIAHRTLVDGFIEASSRAGFIVGLAAGSNDAAMPAKIAAWVKREPSSADGAKRALAAIEARRTIVARMQPAVATWLSRAG